MAVQLKFVKNIEYIMIMIINTIIIMIIYFKVKSYNHKTQSINFN